MVALSFQAQFRGPIIGRTKRQTLRNERRRPIVAGHTLHLFTGMRTRQCKIIGVAKCLGVDPIRLDLENGRVEYPLTGTAITMDENLDALDEFARSDGFAHWHALMAFWDKTHPGRGVWSGIRIFWGDTLLHSPKPEGA